MVLSKILGHEHQRNEKHWKRKMLWIPKMCAYFWLGKCPFSKSSNMQYALFWLNSSCKMFVNSRLYYFTEMNNISDNDYQVIRIQLMMVIMLIMVKIVMKMKMMPIMSLKRTSNHSWTRCKLSFMLYIHILYIMIKIPITYTK